MSIFAIGGAVIKTALPEMKKFTSMGGVEMLIHNGASLFHDIQIAIDDELTERGTTSYPLEEFEKDLSKNKEAGLYTTHWIANGCSAPEGSLTRMCEDLDIPVLIFSALGCDFWHMHANWSKIGERCQDSFDRMFMRMRDPFHLVVMGSAVIHPEVFEKIKCLIKHRDFKADVVDFLDMYRPRTRVAKHGEYYQMTHKEYLTKAIGGDL